MNELRSRTQVLYPIVGALVKAEDILGPSRVWIEGNWPQKRFLVDTFVGAREDLGRIPDITSVASFDVGEINRFLAKHGFQIALDPFTTPGEFGAASVLDVLVEWVTRGAKVVLTRKDTDRQYPGVRIVAKDHNAIVFYRKGFPNPIVCLQTKSEDDIWMTACDLRFTYGIFDQPGVTPELPTAGDRELVAHGEYGGVVFPMVALDHMVDIEWLAGLHTTGEDGRPAVIAQAFQQTRFRMNEIGARAESAVALGVTRSLSAKPKPDLIINEPFLLWIRRPGCRLPLFLGYITEENWKDPGSLGR